MSELGELAREVALGQTRWTLLPDLDNDRVSLEKSLLWQGIHSKSVADFPWIDVVICPESIHSEAFARQLLTITVQSYAKFNLRMLLPDQDLSAESKSLSSLLGVSESLSLQRFFDETSLAERVGILTPETGRSFSGAWVLFLHPQDALHPSALYCLAKASMSLAGDVIFSHESFIDTDHGMPFALRSYPGPGRFGLLSSSCVSRSLMVSVGFAKSCVEKGPDFPLPHEGNPAAAWLLVSEARRIGAEICCLPLCCFGRFAKRFKTPLPRARLDEESAVAESLRELCAEDRVGLAGWGWQESLGSYVPDPVRTTEEIAVIVPFRNQEDLTVQTIRSLARQSGVDRCRLVLVDNNSDPELARRVEKTAVDCLGGERVLFRSRPGLFNFAELNNLAVRETQEPLLLFLNNDIEFGHREVINRLSGFCGWPQVGMVGGLLRYPGGDIQSSGIVFEGMGPEVIRTVDDDALLFREVDALTFACAMVRREVYESVGELDEWVCPNGFGDALFGLRVQAQGWSILLDPLSPVLHYESISRGKSVEELERWELFQSGMNLSFFSRDFRPFRRARFRRLGRQPPSLGKRFYRAFFAAYRELFQSTGKKLR